MFDYNRLEECIAESGKSKSYLCRRIGRKEYYLRDIIRQKNSIPEDYQKTLAEELGTTVEYLNGETDIKNPVSETGNGTYDKVIKIASVLSPEQLEKFLAYGQGIIDAEK